MNKKVIRTVISVILVLSMVCVLPASVCAASLTYYPVVYVAGVEESTLYENPNKTSSSVKFGINDTSDGGFVSSCINMAAALLISSGGNSVNTITKNLNNIFSPIACKADGTSSNPNVSTWYYNQSLATYEGEEIDTDTLNAIAEASGGRINKESIYVCTTDWRIDPFENAAKLKDYIDMVLTDTHSKKVTLLCGGYGGIAGATYLYEYSSHAKSSIDSVTFLNCPLWGNANIGDLMSGQVYQTAGDADSLLGIVDIIDGKARGEAFMSYFKDDPNSFFANLLSSFMGEGTFATLFGAFIKILISTIVDNENIDRDLGKAYNSFLITNETTVYDTVLKKYLRNMPGVWAMVSPEYFDTAMDFMFGEESVNTDLYDKISAYRDVIDNMDVVLNNAKNSGIKTYVVAGYGITNLPLTASVKADSDGILTTRSASAGATTVECGVEWEGYCRCTNAYHDHLDPNGDVDASTCALPENTWFVKNVSHLDYTCETAATFLVWLMTSDSQKTVWDNNFYTQYMKYNKYSDAITAFTNTDEVIGYTYGDYDFSGKVDVEDARMVLRTAIGLEEKPSKYKLVVGDVTGDGYIGVDDARLILRYAINLDAFFPVED